MQPNWELLVSAPARRLIENIKNPHSYFNISTQLSILPPFWLSVPSFLSHLQSLQLYHKMSLIEVYAFMAPLRLLKLTSVFYHLPSVSLKQLCVSSHMDVPMKHVLPSNKLFLYDIRHLWCLLDHTWDHFARKGIFFITKASLTTFMRNTFLSKICFIYLAFSMISGFAKKETISFKNEAQVLFSQNYSGWRKYSDSFRQGYLSSGWLTKTNKVSL